MGYVAVEQDDEGTVHAYPEDAPYIQRDQGLRSADDTSRVVIGDVADVLRAEGHEDDAKRADALYAEACALFEDGEVWSNDSERGNHERNSTLRYGRL